MKKKQNGKQPQAIEPTAEESLSLEAILEEARGLRRQGLFDGEESGAGTEEGEAGQVSGESAGPALEPVVEEKEEDASFVPPPKRKQQAEDLPALLAEEKAADEELDIRQSIFASIRDFLQSKTKDEDGEPDEMMEKYGSVSLGSSRNPEPEDGGSREESFFFGEKEPVEEPEELSEEFSSIFETIQYGREQDQQKAVEDSGQGPMETPLPGQMTFTQESAQADEPSEPQPEAGEAPASAEEQETEQPAFDEWPPEPEEPKKAEEALKTGEEKGEEGACDTTVGESPQETLPQQTVTKEEEPASAPEESERVTKKEEKPQTAALQGGEAPAIKPAEPLEKAERPLTEEERKTAESLETADRLISQEYVTGEVSLEEVIANAQKLVQKRIVPFGNDGEEEDGLSQREGTPLPKREPQGEEKKQAPQKGEEEPSGEKSALDHTAEWDIFEAASSRYEQHFGKPQPARKTPARPAPENRKGRQDAARLYHPEKKERVVVPGDPLETPVREEYASYRGKRPAAPDEPTRMFDVIKGGEASYAKKPPKTPGKAKKKKAAPKKKAPPAPKPKKEHFHLFGDEPDTTPEDEVLVDEVEYIDDYTEPGDAFSVRAEIVGNVRRLLLRTAATAVLTVLGLVLAVFQRLEAENPMSLFAEHVYLYPIFNVLLLLAAAGCCYVPMGNGLSSLVKLHGNSDSAAAFAVLAAAAHSVFAFITPEAYITGALSLYTPLVVLALFLNSIGKLMMVRRIQQNFKFVSAPDQKEAVKIFTDPRLSERMCKGMGVEAPLIAYSRKAGFLTNFLRLSYEPDPSEKLAGKIAPFGALVSLLVGGGIYASTRDIQQAVTSLSITACLCVPMCCVLAVNRPLRRLCRQVNREGAMLVGYPGVRQFADVNVVQVDSNELYPQGSVVLHGIKTFSGQRIDESIMQAAAIMCKVGGPLASTFDQIIQGKENILPRVEALDYEDEMGIVAWVGGARVLLGNRRLLEEHGIAPPSADYEKKYLTGERQATYLASGGDLVAMFVVTYHPDGAVMEELQRLEDNGVSFLVRTYDSNITAKMVSDHYKVAFRSVKVMPHQESRVFEALKEAPEEHTRAYLATRGKASAMHRVVAACVRLKSNISLSLILQMTGVVFSVLLVGLLAFFGGLTQMGTVEMLLYVIFWTAAVLIVPSLRKP